MKHQKCPKCDYEMSQKELETPNKKHQDFKHDFTKSIKLDKLTSRLFKKKDSDYHYTIYECSKCGTYYPIDVE